MSKENEKTEIVLPKEKEIQKCFILKEKANNKDIIIPNDNEITFSKKYNDEELNLFRDDILQYFKENFQDYSKKLHLYTTKINKIEKNFEQYAHTLNKNYTNIINSQANLNSKLDKIKDYESFYNQTNDKLISHEIRLNNIRDDLSKATQKYDKIYLDNLELPGYIGRCAKYKNCQIFFNDVIKEINSLNQFKEKNIIDLKSYKDKLENIIKSFNILVDNNNKSQIKYINTLNKKNISDCQGMVDILGERIRELKVENAKYSMDLISKSEELSKKWDKIEEIKKDLLFEFEFKSNEYKKMSENILNRFNEFKNEYKNIREKFFELADFIKDIRFKKNVKNIYGEILEKKDIKNICNSLNNTTINKNKKDININKEQDLELLKDISPINIKNNDKNDKNGNNLNKDKEISPKKISEYIKKNKYHFRRSVEYNSPILFGIKNSSTIGKNDKLSFPKKNGTIEYNSEKKNINLLYNKTYNYNSNKNEEKEENRIISRNISKEKENSKTIFESKDKKEKLIKEIKDIKVIEEKNKSNDKLLNNLSEPQKKNIIIKKNNNSPEDSNSLIVDNQSTFVNINNSINDNNLSLSSISTFCLNNNNNNNNNKNIIMNDLCLDTNDKVIKELASELEQSTAKKDLNSNKKDEQSKNNKHRIEPLNLIKTIKEEKEMPDSSTQRDKPDIFINSNRENNNNSNQKSDNINNNSSLKKLINEKDNDKNKINNNNIKNNELILYGNNPREIDKKFILTDKKILDLEEYTKEKIVEIIEQIDKLKNITKNVNKNNIKKNNNDINISMKEKKSFNSYGGILSYNNKDKKETSVINNTKKNIFKGLISKNDENKNPNDLTNFEKNKNGFNLTGFNFHKSKLHNIEKISQKIFNSSCKKIKTFSGVKEIEKNYHTTKGKDFIKNNIFNKNDINCVEQKKDENKEHTEKKENKENKKWEIKINNNNDLKKIKYRNNSSGNLYLTQKKGESLSFNETEIKLVYLNKFVNDYLPYAPIDGFTVEEKNI